jgi:hypothetical protein
LRDELRAGERARRGGEEMRGAEEERRGREEGRNTRFPVQERQKPESAEGTQSIRRVTSVRLEVYLGHAGGESGEREE